MNDFIILLFFIYIEVTRLGKIYNIMFDTTKTYQIVHQGSQLAL
jgi:hypothetical protein